MEKQTKNIITKDSIKSELTFYNKADIKSSIVSGIGMLPLFGGMTAFAVIAIWNYVDHTAVKTLLAFMLGILFASPIIIKLYQLDGALAEKKKIEQEGFEIAIRDVRYKCKIGFGRSECNLICFDDFGEVAVDNTNYELASEGDRFYIVHYKGQYSMRLMYSCKTHELKCE